ncbi:hypothetical protein D9615_006067 [Tricholomella constricta]|uniref:Uncharacterized protein n=1 Tax=Tricholomella constricta TaxID=117010 RepID=A0A8H5H9X2_9AGAR|nr:hypothetical protein D9615_006067 [Tricholomella constricta]
MPSQRVTDAAHIAPYLTHAVSHHGQVTLVPPDNAGRVRQSKSNTRSRPRQERNARAEEDVRFNTGPRPLRNLIGNRGGRRPGRQDRARDIGYHDEAYPDYPPPSFLEAISSSSVPNIYSSNSTLVTVSQPISPAISTIHSPAPPLPTSSSPAFSQTFPRSSPRGPAAEDVDSDASSLEIIDLESLQSQPEERFQSSASRLEEGTKRDCNCRGVESASSEARGRTKSRAILDSDPEDTPGLPESPKDTPKRRHLSLSPLRTFFPYRPMAIHDRAFTAHPSPNSSPYSSRTSLPFLSTTSLKMSMSTTSFASSVKGESLFSRRLLSFKGKERATSKESLDAWEFVDSEPSPSLMSAVDSMDTLPAPTLTSSPTRSQSFTYGTPVTIGQPIEPNTALSNQGRTTSPHPLSLRDRKAPPVPIVNRPRRRAPPPPPPPMEIPLAPQGPVLTSVRTRKPPPPPPTKKKPQAIGTSPLGHDSWRQSSIEVEPESNSILERALSTPLPLTPVDVLYVNGPFTPTSSSSEIILVPTHPPPTTEPTNLITAPVVNGRGSDRHVPGSQGLPVSADHRDQPCGSLGAETLPRTNPVDEASPNAHRHYPGRPLPRPPGTTRPLLESTYAGLEGSHTVTGTSIGLNCPEGLLIDLEDDSIVENPISNPPTARIGEATNFTTQSYAASSTSSVFLSGSIEDAPAPTQQEASSEVTPPAQTSSSAPFSEITDLDVLVSRIGDAEDLQDGSNYDVYFFTNFL